MKEYITEAVVLKSSPRNETDKTAEVFTKNFGRLRLRVAGGRKILSKFSPHLEPLNLVVIRLVKKENYTLADILTKKLFAARGFDVSIQAKALELAFFLSSELPAGVVDLNLWFSLIRALDSASFEIAQFLKILGHDASQAKCFICGAGPVDFYSLCDQTMICSHCFRKFPSNELLFIK